MASLRAKLAALAAVLVAALSVSGLARAEIDPRAIAIVPFDQLKFEGQAGHPQTAVVFGDPNKPELYGVVIKWPPHTTSRPHIHLNDRYVTVLSGTWWINTGAKYNPDTMVPMKPGSFITDIAGQIHYDGAKDEPAMIYIVGMGPATGFPREQK